MSDYQDIIYDSEDGVATITMNRPEKHNALRFETIEEMIHAFDRADADGRIGVIVLTGAGERAFCSGGDIDFEDSLDGDVGRRYSKILVRLSETMRSTGKPIIAKIRGWCVGGGNELNLISDLSVAAQSARFGQTGPKMGSVPIWYGTQMLPRLVGDKRAKEIVFICDRYSASQAEAMGWINRAVPDEELDEFVADWCRKILDNSGQSIRVAKLSINFASDQLLPSVKHGFELLNFMHETDEFHEGTRAFIEKRSPAFRDFR